jgi:hypothetical protein
VVTPTPSDWPRYSSAVFYQHAVAAIEWLCAAFGPEFRSAGSPYLGGSVSQRNRQ